MYARERYSRELRNSPIIPDMPRKIAPSSPCGRRLMQLSMERGLTQVQLAELLGSTQRNISHYETVAEFPPTDVLVKLAAFLLPSHAKAGRARVLGPAA